MVRIVLILQFVLLANCSGQNCKYMHEIPYLFSISDKKDAETLCTFYEANRSFFLSQKNSLAPNAPEEIKRKIETLNLSEASISAFVKQWEIDAISHRQKTLERDSLYREGVDCLEKLLKNEVADFEAYTSEAKERLASLNEREIEERKEKAIQINMLMNVFN